MIINIILFLSAFILLWIGSGLAVNAITKISYSLRISSFFVSFFVLGLFTSITEIMIGINAVIKNQPEIYVGNLIGSSVVVFLFIIPLVSIFGNRISLNHAFKFKDLITAALVIGFPAILTLDNKISSIDAIICITIYIYFLFIQEKNNHSFSRFVLINFGRSTIYTSLAKILMAVGIVFIASHILVTQTTTIGYLLGISPFVLSVIVLSIGTNIPEISIAVRAIIARKKDIAFGNYVGSASLNTLELGLLSLVINKPVPAEGSNYSIIMFVTGLVLFLYFGKSRNEISKGEGLVLLLCYCLFVAFELLTGPGWNIQLPPPEMHLIQR